MGIAGGFVVILAIILFVIGLAFLIPGIVGTAITGKVKHGPKVPRVLSIIAMVIGIAMCVLAVLIPVCIVIFSYL